MTRRRLLLALCAVALVVCGLVIAKTTDGAAWTFVGDALYASLLYVLAAIVAPRVRAWAIGFIALGVSAAVEFFQLTGVPFALSRSVPGAALVLGTTFQASDLVAYALGAVAAAGMDALLRRRGDVVSRRAAGSSPGAPTTPSGDARPARPPGGTPSR